MTTNAHAIFADRAARSIRRVGEDIAAVITTDGGDITAKGVFINPSQIYNSGSGSGVEVRGSEPIAYFRNTDIPGVKTGDNVLINGKDYEIQGQIERDNFGIQSRVNLSEART